MSSDTLPHYIRAARKATGLSVKDLGYLLGQSTGSCVSHYESFHRVPSLPKALLLQVVLEKSSLDLFTGMHEEARRLIAERADALLTVEFSSRRSSPRDTARALWLKRLAGHEQTTLPL